MNVILYDFNDFLKSEEGLIMLNDHRLDHINSVLRSTVGDHLQLGEINGSLVSGEIVEISSQKAIVSLGKENQPPPPLDVVLVLGMVRPIMLKRTLLHATILGVKEIHLIHSKRVEKSLWQSSMLEQDALANIFRDGLEQTVDTVFPELVCHKRFKPFVEDQLPEILRNRKGYCAHPYADQMSRSALEKPSVLVVGPEGGFIDYEVQRLSEAGLEMFSLGSRILRVETAVPVLLSQFI